MLTPCKSLYCIALRVFSAGGLELSDWRQRACSTQGQQSQTSSSQPFSSPFDSSNPTDTFLRSLCCTIKSCLSLVSVSSGLYCTLVIFELLTVLFVYGARSTWHVQIRPHPTARSLRTLRSYTFQQFVVFVSTTVRFCIHACWKLVAREINSITVPVCWEIREPSRISLVSSSQPSCTAIIATLTCEMRQLQHLVRNPHRLCAFKARAALEFMAPLLRTSLPTCRKQCRPPTLTLNKVKFARPVNCRSDGQYTS